MVQSTNSSALGSSDLNGISEDDIRAELRRILGSRDFDVPQRVRRFLSFVVEERLAGRANRIKAYTLALEVFGRNADFDFINDPVVRIEAGRLRRGLERYYLLEGRADPLVIDVPKGNYVPRFRRQLNDQRGLEALSPPVLPPDAQSRPRALGWLRHLLLGGSISVLAISALAAFVVMAHPPILTPPLTPGRPSLVVKRFVNLAQQADAKAFAAGLDEEILSQLAPRGELTVFQSEALHALGAAASNAQSRRQFERAHVLEGMVRAIDGKFRITTRLLDGGTTAIIWSGTYEADLSPTNVAETERRLAIEIAAAVSGLLRRPKSRQM